jgi:hypothetical protein
MLHAEDQKRSLEYIINLRWAELPAPLERERVVVIGTRYDSGDSMRLKKLETHLDKIGLKIVTDNGEFGGGPLTYEIVKSFSNRRNLLVLELTLSRQLVENDTTVIDVLNMLASF